MLQLQKMEEWTWSLPLCRICLLELRDGGKIMKMECLCKGDFALAHKDCAIKWFSLRGNSSCDICGQDIGDLPLVHCQPSLLWRNNVDAADEEFARSSWHQRATESLRRALASLWHKFEELYEFP